MKKGQNLNQEQTEVKIDAFGEIIGNIPPMISVTLSMVAEDDSLRASSVVQIHHRIAEFNNQKL